MNHEYFMKFALEEAQKGEGIVSPNPLVGAVLVKYGNIIGKGFHGEMGELHAERVVFEKLKNKINLSKSDIPDLDQESKIYEKLDSRIHGNSNSVRQEGLILYVTLEPCCHYGKTPPCTEAIIQAGIKKVIIAQIDPNPLVYGKGIEILKQAGIEVIVGVLEEEAKYQIRFFNHWITKNEPYFFAKLAISADGFYAKEGENILISSKSTKRKTKEMRSQFDAILVGKKTLLIDNPKLSCDKRKNLKRIIFCQKADFSIKNLEAFRDDNVIIACKEKTEECDFLGQMIFYKDLKDFKKQLFNFGIQSVLVEGGGELMKLFLDENIVQEVMIVESKNKKLETGKKFPVINTEFEFFKKEDIGDDVLKYFLKN